MSDLPTISIVTCSYQQGSFLDATLRSVLDQAYPGLEYIVIDGGSTDGSTDVIRQHAARLAYWVSEPDAGQTDALCKGFDRATGDVMGWLCSDDLLVPGALAQVGAYFVANPDVQAVCGDALWIDAQGRYLRPKKEMAFNRFSFMFDHNFVAQPSMFWRRGLYRQVGGLARSFNLAMDSDLWERFSRAASIAHVAQYWSCMRYYPEQKTRSLKPQAQREDALIRARSPLAAQPALLPLLRWLARGRRIAGKLVAGGYGARPDPALVAAVEAYRLGGSGT